MVPATSAWTKEQDNFLFSTSVMKPMQDVFSALMSFVKGRSCLKSKVSMEK